MTPWSTFVTNDDDIDEDDVIEFEQATHVYGVAKDKVSEALRSDEFERLIGEVPDDVANMATVMALIHYAIFLRVIGQHVCDGLKPREGTDDKENFMELASDLYDDFHGSSECDIKRLKEIMARDDQGDPH
jgi:hypothetical protein